MKNFYTKAQKIFRILPFLFLIGGIFLYISMGKNITIEQILEFTPKNYFLAIVSLLGMYALKSLSIVFPIAMLYIATGVIFHTYLAIIINIIGIAIALSIPYWIGHLSDSKMTSQLVRKYPKLQQINSLRQNSEYFFVFIIRIIGIIPMDVVSMFMGSNDISYRKYLIASILAMMPDLLAITFISASITNPRSPKFILSCIAKFAITAISILVYRRTVKKDNN